MLSKNQRLPRVFFSYILKNSKKYNTPFLFARIAKLPEEHRDEQTRCSFVVSKKSAKTAVLRHLLKRRGYNAVQTQLNELKKGYGVIFYIQGDASQLSHQVLLKEVIEIFTQSKLYATKS